MTGPAPIRLAYLVSQYPSVTHTFILREIRALRARGFDIQAISVRPTDRVREKLSKDELEEHDRTFEVLAAGIPRIFTAHLLTLLRRPAAYVAGLWTAVRLARGSVPKIASHLGYFAEAVVVGHRMRVADVSHLHSHFTSTVALLTATVFPVTFSVTIHGPDEFNDVVGFHIAEKVAKAKFVCAISQYGQSQLMRASSPSHWKKIKVCPLGVDRAVFRPSPQRDSSPCFELLCVGRLAPVKAQIFLIRALDRLIREGRHHLRLRLAGDGPDYSTLKAAIVEANLQEHVLLEGACGQDRVLELYRNADMFVLASFAEGLPVVLMEAMAMGIPCIATWVNGIPEIIRHGIDGWLVAPADELQLAEAIAHLIDHPEVRRQIAEAARDRVADKYDLGRNVARLAELYEQLLSS